MSDDFNIWLPVAKQHRLMTVGEVIDPKPVKVQPDNDAKLTLVGLGVLAGLLLVAITSRR